MKDLLGGKGANLAEMATIGLSVPPGLTITTETCGLFHANGSRLPDNIWEDVLKGLKTIEQDLGFNFGDPERALLVSVRSGAAISMPGMMDTVLNLGLNDEVVAGLAKKSGERFAYDSYRRFIDMFGNVVMDVSHSSFEEELEHLKKVRGVSEDTELNTDDLKTLVDKYKLVYKNATGSDFPSEPYEQLRHAISAVFNSWNSTRAIKYRTINQITGLKGTAVNVQAMVYGNMGNTSGTGVLFTRNPSTGEPKLYGEFLVNAQFKNPAAYKDQVVATGLPASPGAAIGQIVFSADDAEAWQKEGKQVRTETSPEDVGGMHAAQGILTARGGMTSHAAVVARGWGKCCVAGCADIHVNDVAKVMTAATMRLVKMTIMMASLPVTIRLLDPPLHEFLPEGDVGDMVEVLAKDSGISTEEILSRIEKLSEVNPMLGFRGCRLGISYPELTRMQARAIMEAAVACTEHGVKVHPEIMVPLVGGPQELAHQTAVIRKTAEEVMSHSGVKIDYLVGTMIEVPRAALVSDEVSKNIKSTSV
ncbi:hypothetical protein CBR_g50184 [Chara braunii]|uniref:pyruvate, phosphate dikinase n=1 Tax=Chara braunii TaxID=69332 RepID=A0A388M6A5_CHABU|nr:hypothetical protein CBR_g50184 [Chara braunii]|eukprot:GBG90091.1 hypothetical protein CBR_g50184 [Chara braunii]